MIGIPLFVFHFSNFSEDFRQRNCGVPLRISRPTMLKWSSRYMTSFAEETGHHLLRSDFSKNNYHWNWLGFKGWTVAHRSMIRHMSRSFKRLLRHRQKFFSNFLYTNRRKPVLSDCLSKQGQIFFSTRCPGNIECKLMGKNAQG